VIDPCRGALLPGGIAREAEARLPGKPIAQCGCGAHAVPDERPGVIRRSVVDHGDDSGRVRELWQQFIQARRKIVAPVARADRDVEKWGIAREMDMMLPDKLRTT